MIVRPQQLQFNMQQTKWWMEGDDDMSFHLDWLKKIAYEVSILVGIRTGAAVELKNADNFEGETFKHMETEDIIVTSQPERMRLNCKSPAVHFWSLFVIYWDFVKLQFASVILFGDRLQFRVMFSKYSVEHLLGNNYC